jgi:hypothetical protein
MSQRRNSRLKTLHQSPFLCPVWALYKHWQASCQKRDAPATLRVLSSQFSHVSGNGPNLRTHPLGSWHRWRDLSPHIKLDMVTPPRDLRSLRCIVRVHASQGLKLRAELRQINREYTVVFYFMTKSLWKKNVLKEISYSQQENMYISGWQNVEVDMGGRDGACQHASFEASRRL